jgi:hypothetical protein
MSGTFKWLGGTDSNDAGNPANWQVLVGSSFEQATIDPAAGDTVTITNGGIVDDSTGDWPIAAPETIYFSGTGGTLELGGTQDLSGGDHNNHDVVVVDPGAAAVITGNAITSDATIAAAGPGASLSIEGTATGTSQFNGIVWAAAGGNISLSGGSYVINSGVLATDGGTVTLGGTQLAGLGLLVVDDASIDATTLLHYGDVVLFATTGTAAAAGTVTFNPTGTQETRVLGFQSGDTIDLPGFTFANTNWSLNNSRIVVLVDAGKTMELNFSGAGFSLNSIDVTSNPTGGVMVTAASSVVDREWANPVSGDWATGSVWASGTMPGTADNVVIGNIGTAPGPNAFSSFEVTATGEQVGSVVLAAPEGTLALSGSFTATRNISDAVGTVLLQPGADVTTTSFGQYTGGATLVVESGATFEATGSSPISNNGTLAVDADANVTIDGGTLNAAGGSDIIGWFNNDARTVARSGASVTTNYTALGFSGSANGTLTIDGATWTDAGTLGSSPHAGEMLVGGGEINTSNSGTVLPGGAGTLVIENSAVLNDQSAAVAAGPTTSGTVQISDGGVWNVAGNLSVGGFNNADGAVSLFDTTTSTGGSLTVGGTLNLNGQMSVSGSSDVQANFLQINGGTLSVDNTSTFNVGGGSANGNIGLVIDANATASATDSTMNGNIALGGTLDFSGTSNHITADVQGSGTVALVGPGSAFEVFGSGTFTPAVAFNAAGGSELTLGFPGDFAGTLLNFVPGATGEINTLDIVATQFSTLTYNAGNGVLTLGQSGDGFSQTFQLQIGLLQSDFTIQPANGGSGTEVLATPCYALGTHIATPHGDVPVATLRAGDAVLALEDGAWQARPVRWVGRFTVDLAHHPAPHKAAPVRILAHAFGDGLPYCDLLVSPDHALYLNGVLIQAQALVNGATVVQEVPARVTYFHVELERHAVLLAEGLPAESYLDTGNRAVFDGERGVRAVHPDLASAAAWDERACAPLVLGGARLARAQASSLALAKAQGFALSENAQLRLYADGRPLRRGRAGAVMLPAGTRTVSLRSRHFVPRWFGVDDTRRLGVAVTALRLDAEPVPDAAYGAGWHAADAFARWTDGDATLNLRPLATAKELLLRTVPVGACYWVPPAATARVAIAS